MPDHIANLYDDLEEDADANSVLRRIAPCDAGWLSQYVREQISKDREKASMRFDEELNVRCTFSDRGFTYI